MAKQTITNGQGGSSVRSALNSNFTELYDNFDALPTTYVALTGNQTIAGNKAFSSATRSAAFYSDAEVVSENAGAGRSVQLLADGGGNYIKSSHTIAFQNNSSAAQAITAGNITSSALVTVGVYTFATLPSASANTGALLRISDRGQKLGYSDGTDWRFVHDNAVVS